MDRVDNQRKPLSTRMLERAENVIEEKKAPYMKLIKIVNTEIPPEYYTKLNNRKVEGFVKLATKC